MTRFKCEECGKIFEESEMLRAPHPFIPAAEVGGCPSCHEIDLFCMLCDEPGCQDPVSCGFPSPTGYRQTCCVHYQTSLTTPKGH